MRKTATGAALAALLVTLSAAGALAASAQPAQKTPQKAAPAQQAQQAQPSAETPAVKKLGEAQGWTAYSSPEKNGLLCYLVGHPQKSEPAAAKRESVHALVTHNTADKTANVVSFIAGYPFKEGSDAELDIGGKKFSLFTKGDTAWARDAGTDKAIVEAMQKGKQVVVKGTSQRGTQTTDTYALTGFGQVLGEIDKACKVKR